MKLKLQILSALVMFAISTIKAQWTDPKTDTLGYGYDLIGLAPANSNTWIAAGGNAIVFRTTDGWQTFSKLNTSIYTSVRTANAGYNGYFSIHTSPDNWFSNNYGNTWNIQGSGIEYCNMIDSAYGIGTYGCGVLRTVNGGQSWSAIGGACSNNNSMSGISFPSKAVGFVCGNNSTFARTLDSGATWVNIATNAGFLYSGIAYDVFFVDQNVGYVSRGVNSTGGMLKKTTNGGTSWTDLSSNFQAVAGSANKNMRIYFLDANTGYVSHGGKIYKTTDGGNTWALDHTHPRRDPNVYTYSSVKRKGNTLVFSGDGCMVSVLKLSTGIGINELQQNKLQLEVYPNPVNEKVNINSNNRMKKIEVFNLIGNQILSYDNVNNTTFSIELENLNSGLYMIKVLDELQQIRVTKVVVRH